jgi:hypothetical protein
VLLTLTIISTVAAVSSALSALIPQRRRAGPQTVVIVVTGLAALTIAEREHDRLSEGGIALESDA